MKRKLKISAIPTTDNTDLKRARLFLAALVMWHLDSPDSAKVRNNVVKFLNKFAKKK